MVGVSRDARLNHAREVLRRAGSHGAEIVESCPSNRSDALRSSVANELVALGEAEWTSDGRLRTKEANG